MGEFPNNLISAAVPHTLSYANTDKIRNIKTKVKALKLDDHNTQKIITFNKRNGIIYRINNVVRRLSCTNNNVANLKQRTRL